MTRAIAETKEMDIRKCKRPKQQRNYNGNLQITAFQIKNVEKKKPSIGKWKLKQICLWKRKNRLISSETDKVIFMCKQFAVFLVVLRVRCI